MTDALLDALVQELRDIQDKDTGFEDPAWVQGWSDAIDDALRIVESHRAS